VRFVDKNIPLGRSFHVQDAKVRYSKNFKWHGFVIISKSVDAAVKNELLVIPYSVVCPLRDALNDIIAKRPAPMKKKIVFQASTTRRGTRYNSSA
jgi:hypothetical protein